MRSTRPMRLLAMAAVAVVVLGSALPARTSTAGSFSFAMKITVPDFPCPGDCSATSLSGRVSGAIGRTGLNGVTTCIPSCSLSLGPRDWFYSDHCVAGTPFNGGGSGQVQVNGGSSLGAGAALTPLVIDFSRFGYFRLGTAWVASLALPQEGVLVGLWRPVSGIDCVRGNGPATFQVVGVGVMRAP